MKQASSAHAVKFNEHDGRGVVYGYIIFPISPSNPVNVGNQGPIASVYNQSVIMVEETTSPRKLYIAVNSPQLKLRRKNNAPSWCNGGAVIDPTKNGEVGDTLLFCAHSNAKAVHVNIRNNNNWTQLKSLYVDGKNKTSDHTSFLETANPSTQNPVKFVNLKNGDVTEVTFE